MTIDRKNLWINLLGIVAVAFIVGVLGVPKWAAFLMGLGGAIFTSCFYPIVRLR